MNICFVNKLYINLSNIYSTSETGLAGISNLLFILVKFAKYLGVPIFLHQSQKKKNFFYGIHVIVTSKFYFI